MNHPPTPPSLGLALSEIPRAAGDGLKLISGLNGLVRKHQGGNNHPVLVLPGYGAADGSTVLMRHFLGRIGYQPYALAAGRNVEGMDDRIRSVDDATRFRERLVEVAVSRVRDIYKETREPISLIGWSMGGLYALDASKILPEITRNVITLGSPFGDLRGTSLFNVMRRLSGSEVPIESQDFASWLVKASAPSVPTCVIYSESDGIVGRDIAQLPDSPLTKHVRVKSSHLGFSLNIEALGAVATALNAN